MVYNYGNLESGVASNGIEHLGDVFGNGADVYDKDTRFAPEQSPFLKDNPNEVKEAIALFDAMNEASTINNHETFPHPSPVELVDERMTPLELDRKHTNEVVTYTKLTFAWRHYALDPVAAHNNQVDQAA